MSGPISFVKFIVSLSQLPAFQYASTAWLLILSTVFQFWERYLPTCDGSKKGNSFSRYNTQNLLLQNDDSQRCYYQICIRYNFSWAMFDCYELVTKIRLSIRITLWENSITVLLKVNVMVVLHGLSFLRKSSSSCNASLSM